MKLLLKFDLLLIALMGIGLAALSIAARSFLIDNAKAQVVQQAQLMMESASSTRQYTTEELKPLLQKSVAHRMKFLPQTADAMLQETTFPTRDRRSGGVQQVLNLLVRNSIREQQNHPRPHYIARRKHPRLRHLLEFLSLLFGQG